MTNDEFIFALCKTYNEPISKDNIKLRFIKRWTKENFTPNELDCIYYKILQEFKPTSTVPFPLIPHIKEILKSEKETDADAREAAALILTCIGKHGYTRPKSAEKEMGSLAWEVVKRQGGWYSVCVMARNESETTLQAQWRDLAKSIMIRRSSGKNYPPRLEDANRVLDRLGGSNNILKSIK